MIYLIKNGLINTKLIITQHATILAKCASNEKRYFQILTQHQKIEINM